MDCYLGFSGSKRPNLRSPDHSRTYHKCRGLFRLTIAPHKASSKSLIQSVAISKASLWSLNCEAKLYCKERLHSFNNSPLISLEKGSQGHLRAGVLLWVRINFKIPIRSQGCGVDLKCSHDRGNGGWLRVVNMWIR